MTNAEAIFNEIKHGDEAYQVWLLEKLRTSPTLRHMEAHLPKPHKCVLFKSLIDGLENLANSPDGTNHIAELGLDHNAYSVFAQLRHWELIVSKGKRSGIWAITEKGRQFLAEEITIPKWVWIHLNEAKAFSTELVYAHEITFNDVRLNKPEHWSEDGDNEKDESDNEE